MIIFQLLIVGWRLAARFQKNCRICVSVSD